MSNLTGTHRARVDRAAIALLLAYICLLPVSWSGLPFNIQWVDVLFPALLLCTIATRPSFQLARFDVVVLVYLLSSLLSLLGTTGLQHGLVQFAKHGYLALLYGVIVMLTAKAMPDDQQKCIDAGANDYMAKPIDVDKLLSLVRVWMPR